MKWIALVALLLPAAAGAQGYVLGTPSIADALRRVDRLAAQSDVRDTYEQRYVLPERAGQNRVAWYRFEWEYIDLPAPGGGRGGIRLYYYRSALAQAQRALPAIQSAYARLVELFAYQPTKRIPFFLYATQREFQANNVFQVGEGTLGVTGTGDDFKMLVPYFGDHARFVEVATHEMVHQFYIQKLQDAADAEEIGSLAGALPLWFTEGIAEYYSKGGLDNETENYLRDLVWNPDVREGYAMIPFAEDRARGFIPTYKLGQARLAFIAEQYGRDKIQGFIENAYLMGDGATGGPGGRSFGGLVRRVLDEPLEQVELRWQTWLKRRYYAQYLQVRQDLSAMKEVRNLPYEPEDFTTSPDGQMVLVRGIDREKGRAKLFLFDVRNPQGWREVASDQKPGSESLHPIEYSVGAVGPGILAFSAQDGQGDSLYVRRYRVRENKEGRPAGLELGRVRKLRLKAAEGAAFVQIADPTFSTDGSHIAFSGLLQGDAQSDVYVVPAAGGEVRRVTNDPYVEKDLHWGTDGIYVASDATDHGLLNLFRVDAGTGEKTRLTTGAHADRHPFSQADGSVLYSSDASGKNDLWLLRDGQTRRLTDFTTGLTSPAPAPRARGILASTWHGGKLRMVEVPKVAWLETPPVAIAPAAGDVLEIPRTEWPEQPEEYEGYALRNWKPQGGYVYGGGSGASVAGRAVVAFADLMRDQSLYVDVAVSGSFDYTQALVLYQNVSKRYPFGLGAFHYVQQGIDAAVPTLSYLQRDFGVAGILSYPLDRFRRFDTTLALGGVQRYCPTTYAQDIAEPLRGRPCNATETGDFRNPRSRTEWNDQFDQINPQISPAISLGYDTTRFDYFTGPLSGSSATVELGGTVLPTQRAVTGFVRADLQRYFQIGTRANLGLRFAAGASFSGNDESKTWERNFWLTASDNLRGLYPGEYSRLIGRNYYVANAELQLPLNSLVRFFIFDYVEGVAALDFGGVFDYVGDRIVEERVAIPNAPDGTDPYRFVGVFYPGAWSSRTLTGVLGFNFIFGPLVLKLHWGHPFDIGGFPTAAQVNGSKWVTHLTLGYLYF